MTGLSKLLPILAAFQIPRILNDMKLHEGGTIPKKSVQRVVVGICLWLGLLMLSPDPIMASEPCNPPNVIPREVCDMDSFRGSPPREIPNGWTEFILDGNPEFSAHVDTFFGPPSLMIRDTGNPFKVGIYTQVPVTPGAGYRASISWGAPNEPDAFGRQLGIDPTGGTDPNAPTVIWGPMHWGPARILNYPPPDVNIDVRARALGETATVFFLVDHPYSTGDNLIFIDAIALYPDDSAPQVELPPTETPTPEPVVVQAAAAPPTWTPSSTFTPTTPPTPTPTFTPTPTPTLTPTPIPTFTPTPTWTPWPTATPNDDLLAMAQMRVADATRSGSPVMLLFLGIASFGGAGILGGSYWSLRRRR